jgi:hypothetical protein
MKEIKKYISLIIVIALSMQLLSTGSNASAISDAEQTEIISNAVKWLEHNQNSDGSWGQSLQIIHTSEVLKNIPHSCLAKESITPKWVYHSSLSSTKSII